METPSQQQQYYFGRYQLIAEVGRGGMGRVYKAYDPQLDRFIALKVVVSIDEQSKDVERFLREAKAMAKLRHTNIITAYDIGIQEGQPFFTMDLIEGGSLKEFIKSNKFNFTQLLQILIKVGKAVHYAHSQKIIHRDIKPANIMLSKDKEPVVMDFGLAKVASGKDDISKTGDILGTPAYMPPEQFAGKAIDIRSDIYSLGATLYEGLTGRPPFQGRNYANMFHQICHQEPISPRSLNTDISKELEAITLKCLEKDPARRYQNASLWAKDLTNFLENRPILAKPPTIWTYMFKYMRRHSIAFLAIFFTLLTMITGSIFSFLQWQRAETEKRAKTQEAESSAIRLAKITFAKAKEAASRNEWRKCGALAGAGLQIIQKLEKYKVLVLRKMGYALIRTALYKEPLLWEEKVDPKKQILSCVWSPNGKIIAYGYSDGSISLRKAATSELINTLKGHSKGVTQLFWHRDLLVSAAAKESFCIWNSLSGQFIFGHKLPGLYYVVVGADKKSLYTITKDRGIELWRFGKRPKTIITTYPRVDFEYWSPNRQIALFLGDTDKKSIKNKIFVWDIKNNKQIKVIAGHKREINSILWRPDNKMFVTVHGGYTIRLWDATTYKAIAEYKEHNSYPNKVAWSPDSKLLACGSDDLSLHIWDVATHKRIAIFASLGSEFTSLFWHPDSSIIAANNYGTALFDIKKRTKITTLPTTHSRIFIQWNKTGELLTSFTEKRVAMWENPKPKHYTINVTNNDLLNGVKSPDGKQAVCPSSNMVYLLGKDKLEGIYSKKVENITNLEWKSNKKVIIHSATKTYTWEINKKNVLEYGFFNQFINGVPKSPDGKVDVQIKKNDLVLQYAKNSKQIAVLSGHKDKINFIAWSPNGRFLASASKDGTARIWNATNYKVLYILNRNLMARL